MSMGRLVVQLRTSQGISLVELLMAMAIIAILLQTILPSLHELSANQRHITQVNQLIGHLHLARSEALKRRSWVVMCKSADGEFCSSQGDWQQGWILFQDDNRNRSREADEPLIYHYPGNSSLRVRHRGYPAYSSNRYVVYYPDGSSLGNGTFTICDPRGYAAPRAVIMARSGRVRADMVAADGSALNCDG